ncbi:MAG TPA: acetyl-CoA carboxylase biotin carboxylase subunit [Sedimentisphaerales bacterium]|nr:acetyl-CoA carboxylase biotin carboxylase subunit [Sedimentisphaerales bacterium]
MFSRILIANRGEIALRVIRACHELGVEAVAVYSEADRGAAYLDMADEAICIGPASPAQSYLNIPAIISAAEIGDVEAIHPGYGFLAENAHFAEICRDCGIAFIGPSPESMKMLGDKVEARRIAHRAKVSVTPGSDGEIATESEALKIANKIGYPVIIKAAAGGGGRGMRVVHNDISLHSAYNAAKSEAEAAFKNPAVYMERYVVNPRHVEVQVLADNNGHTIHLYERDCTVQRRHQKLIEESPCPILDEKTRDEICRAALRVVREAKYANAATVEFLLDKHKRFYFMEVNARIQVEHPVTELVTGVDLIKWQIRIAAGQPLTIKQKDIHQKGVAMECRINAEDPQRNFSPCPGPIEQFIAPGGFGVRVDTHIYQGAKVTPYYDSMIAKLLVHQPTRAEAITTMKRALSEFKIGPIKTTIPAHLEILSHNLFIKNEIDTGFIERNL